MVLGYDPAISFSDRKCAGLNVKDMTMIYDRFAPQTMNYEP
jgi:hypothetical protein